MPTLPEKLTKGPSNLVRWLNDMREFVRRGRVLSDGVMGWDDTGDGLLPPSPATSAADTNALYATLAGETIRVTNGFINGSVIPEMDGSTLDTIPAPTLTIGSLPYFVCLKITWDPLADGETPDFYASGVAEITTAEIVGESGLVPDVTTPTVNATTGAVTQVGIAYFAIAEWVDDGDGNPILSSRNSGHRWFTVCGADEAKFVWNGQ